MQPPRNDLALVTLDDDVSDDKPRDTFFAIRAVRQTEVTRRLPFCRRYCPAWSFVVQDFHNFRARCDVPDGVTPNVATPSAITDEALPLFVPISFGCVEPVAPQAYRAPTYS